MVRTTHRLNPRSVAAKKRRGYYADGGGLYLQISKFGTKSWAFRYTIQGRAREMGLGPIHTVTLAEARSKAMDNRKLLLDGVDPIAIRNEKRIADKLAAAKIMTFADCARAYILAHREGWKNAKHISQWQNTLATYADPIIGALPVQVIDTALVMRVLEPLWSRIPETGSRLRGRIESVLDWATVRRFRSGDNPARWRGHLDALLPNRSKVRSVQHLAALPYSELPAFMAALQEQDGVGARALEFLILTAARTGEVIDAKRNEIDRQERVWVIHAGRMKAKKEHRVPLSRRALDIIEAMQQQQSDFIFPGTGAGKALSDTALLDVVERMGRGDLTVHGFRSTFRDWAAERTNYPREVAEAALAHTLSDKVEAAYRRGDLFEKRRRLMVEWAKYCYTRQSTAKVVSMNRA
jgi:integrase